MAAFALRELAPDRVESADALLEAATDRDLHVRRAALTAMASLLGPPKRVALQLLHVVANDADGASRRLAALALGELGAADAQSIPPETRARLEAAATSGDADLRRAIERACARLAS
jgi:HEAT repeat protein